jgi:hypothetical protein
MGFLVSVGAVVRRLSFSLVIRERQTIAHSHAVSSGSAWGNLASKFGVDKLLE